MWIWGRRFAKRVLCVVFTSWIVLSALFTISCKKQTNENPGLEPPVVDLVVDNSEEYSQHPAIMMTMGGVDVTLEVVKDPEERRQGLMYRDTLASNAGMLFVFPSNVYGPFWMKNTYIPLSIAFISSDCTIIDIQQMEPLDTVTKYMPSVPYRYAIEMNAGWFRENDVKVGYRITIPELP